MVPRIGFGTRPSTEAFSIEIMSSFRCDRSDAFSPLTLAKNAFFGDHNIVGFCGVFACSRTAFPTPTSSSARSATSVAVYQVPGAGIQARVGVDIRQRLLLREIEQPTMLRQPVLSRSCASCCFPVGNYRHHFRYNGRFPARNVMPGSSSTSRPFANGRITWRRLGGTIHNSVILITNGRGTGRADLV